MKKNIIIIVALTLVAHLTFGQKYFSKAGKITFTSNTPLEKIEGTNNSGTTVIDGSNGNIEYAVLIKSFIFEKALLQEHFNENYMESTKFPKATFKGKIDNFSTVNVAKNGSYKVKISGNLTIHGVTKAVTTDAVLNTKDGAITSGATNFEVSPQDYNIAIPALVKDKIAKSIKIVINTDYKKM
jgi:YceI-like domain